VELVSIVRPVEGCKRGYEVVPKYSKEFFPMRHQSKTTSADRDNQFGRLMAKSLHLNRIDTAGAAQAIYAYASVTYSTQRRQDIAVHRARRSMNGWQRSLLQM
jgi:hypothetical protein